MAVSELKIQSEERANPSWLDACLALDLASVMLSGNRMPLIHVRARSGPVLEAWLEILQNRLACLQVRKLPTGIDEARLLGGIDLAATLATGKRQVSSGLLVEAHQGLVTVPSAQTMDVSTVHHLTAALDNGFVKIEREGVSLVQEARFGLVLIDGAEEDEEGVHTALQDRMTFHLDLNSVSYRDIKDHRFSTGSFAERSVCEEKYLKDICSLALEFGLRSLRSSMQAVDIAIACARMRGREQVGDEDIAIAVRLSLLNRATQMPEQIEEEANSAAEAEPDDENQTESLNENDDLPPDELDVETLLANLPSSLLSQLQGSVKKSQRTKQQGRRGQMRKDGRRGRPLTSRRGRPRSGHRLDILSTLRAAAPWQKLRSGQDADQDNLRVYASDFHVKRFRQPTETTTIFLVDASGSTAINRLGEAKGAIERLLAESYSARDNVALIAFRKEGAQLLLPPTRSLTRVKRSLAVLPGGGGTPLAAGLRAALQLAEQESRSGRSVTMALLTDGNANVTLDGIGNRATANEEAMQVAREISNCGHACLLIDINKLPNPRAKTLSEVMGADYLPMPFTGSQNLARAICAYRG